MKKISTRARRDLEEFWEIYLLETFVKVLRWLCDDRFAGRVVRSGVPHSVRQRSNRIDDFTHGHRRRCFRGRWSPSVERDCRRRPRLLSGGVVDGLADPGLIRCA